MRCERKKDRRIRRVGSANQALTSLFLLGGLKITTAEPRSLQAFGFSSQGSLGSVKQATDSRRLLRDLTSVAFFPFLLCSTANRHHF